MPRPEAKDHPRTEFSPCQWTQSELTTTDPSKAFTRRLPLLKVMKNLCLPSHTTQLELITTMSNTKLKTQHSILNSLLLSVKPIHTAAITAHPTPTTPPTAHRIHTVAITAHPTATPHTAAHTTATPHTAAHPTATPHTAARPTTTPHTAAHPTATPHTAAHTTATPHTAAHPTATPHTAARPTTTPHTAAHRTHTITAHPITTTATAMVTTLVTELMTPTMERTGMSNTTRKMMSTTGPWLKTGLAKSSLKTTKINLVTSLVKLSLS
jgi:hypothetical protein